MVALFLTVIGERNENAVTAQDPEWTTSSIFLQQKNATSERGGLLWMWHDSKQSLENLNYSVIYVLKCLKITFFTPNEDL